MKFNVGDVVQLNSGGPAMTVESPADSGYNCQWFSQGCGFVIDTFPAASLRLYSQAFEGTGKEQ